MLIQVNTDKNIDGSEGLAAYVREAVESGLGRLADHLTRIEVHLGDENGAKEGGLDKRCMLEARQEGRPPVAVACNAATLNEAVNGAVGKLQSLLESTLGRLRDESRHRTDPV